MMSEIAILEKKLNVEFKDPNLLRMALVHRSYLNENPDFELNHNERLEFLGDAVLELVVTEFLYLNYENPEGELTTWRSALVNSVMLAKVSKALGINDFLLLSRGEAKGNGRARELILANAFEAMVGAIYLDQGFEAAKNFIKDNLLSELDEIIEKELYLDPKSHLQEVIQEDLNITPMYEVLSEWGPDHDKRFRVGVYIYDKLIGEGEGTSKQSAQVEAAKAALAEKKWQ